MLKLLYNWLFKPCQHEWKIDKEIEFTKTFDTYKQEGFMFLYICQKCGKIQKETLP